MKKIVQTICTFLLSKVFLFLSIGRVFASDSPWADKARNPWWEIWGPFFVKMAGATAEGIKSILPYVLGFWIILMILVVGYAAYFFFQEKKPSS